MKAKLLFFIAVLTANIGFSQNVLGQFEGLEDTTGLSLLGDTTTTLSNIVTQFNGFQIQEENFVISPNPSKNKLNIKLPSAKENLKLEVFDVLGKLIYKLELTELESSINVSNWKSGVYLVRVSSDKGAKTKRFIKE